MKKLPFVYLVTRANRPPDYDLDDASLACIKIDAGFAAWLQARQQELDVMREPPDEAAWVQSRYPVFFDNLDMDCEHDSTEGWFYRSRPKGPRFSGEVESRRVSIKGDRVWWSAMCEGLLVETDTVPNQTILDAFKELWK